jgi:hypothetical protein
MVGASLHHMPVLQELHQLALVTAQHVWLVAEVDRHWFQQALLIQHTPPERQLEQATSMSTTST